jgi:hypothetical protein
MTIGSVLQPGMKKEPCSQPGNSNLNHIIHTTVYIKHNNVVVSTLASYLTDILNTG